MGEMHEIGCICVCCGKTVTEGTNICRVCVMKISKHPVYVSKECEYWNDNGMFCELTGLGCIGSDCQSYKEIFKE